MSLLKDKVSKTPSTGALSKRRDARDGGSPSSPTLLPDSNTVFDLSEVAEKFAQSVPFRFQVVNGFMAENQKDPTIGVDEVYSVHLVKEMKVVLVKHGREKLEIPVNSISKFSLVQECGSKLYDTVEDIMSDSVLPKVIGVLHNRSINSDGVLSLTCRKKDVLFVKEVVKSTFGRKTGLRAFSTFQNKIIVLPKDCDAKFTTDPKATQLYLTDFLDNGINFIPCRAHIFPSKGSPLAASLSSNIITIEKLETHRSVIVSLFRDNPNARRKKEASYIDIPTTINIRVNIVKTEKSDVIYDRIFKESRDLMCNFNPSKIQHCVDAHSDDQYMTQAQLLAEIRKERTDKEMAESTYFPQQYQKLLSAPETTTYELVSSPPPGTKPKVAMSSENLRGKDQFYQELLPKRDTENSQYVAPANKMFKQLQPNIRQPVPLPSTTRKEPPPVPIQKPSRSSVDIRPKIPANSKKSSEDRHLYENLPSLKKDNSQEGLSLISISSSDSSSYSIAELPDKDAPSANVVAGSSSPNVKCAQVGASDPVNRSTANQMSTQPQPANKMLLQSSISANQMSTWSSLPANQMVTRSVIPANQRLAQSSTPANQAMSTQLSEIQSTLLKITNQIDSINKRQSDFEGELRDLKRALPQNESNSSLESIIITPDMTPENVQSALSTAGLSQYKEAFAREAVDGEMFLILDHAILQDELGVNARLHRLRLLKMKGTN